MNPSGQGSSGGPSNPGGGGPSGSGPQGGGPSDTNVAAQAKAGYENSKKRSDQSFGFSNEEWNSMAERLRIGAIQNRNASPRNESSLPGAYKYANLTKEEQNAISQH